MSKKLYVLDTNIYLTDFEALYKFGTNDIVIPLKVLEEVDNQKKRQDGVGLNARNFIRILDDLRAKGNLNKGVRIDKGLGIVRAKSSNISELPSDFDKTLADNIILACALLEKKENPDKKIIVVSQDINLRVRCDALGLHCEAYTENQVVKRTNDIFTGCSKLLIDDQEIDKFYAGSQLHLESDEFTKGFRPNEFVILVSSTNDKKTAMARFVAFNKPLLRVKEYSKGREGTVFGLTPRNKEQQMALNLLMDDNVPVVTLMGSAGSGKTLMAVAAALEHVINGEGEAVKKYEKIIISRPIMPMGKDIGFLPGPQPLDAKILTPSGWTTMGELEIGSEVISRDGTPSKVLKIIKHGIKDIYKVTTSDEVSTECCEDHLWVTTTKEEKKRSKSGNLRTTKDIISTFKNKKDKLNHYLPRNQAVQFNSRDLKLSPYVLGAILGDGSISDSISIATTDSELVLRVENEIKDLNCRLQNNGKNISYTISSNLYNNKPAKFVKITDLQTGKVEEYHSTGMASKALNINKTTIGSRCKNNVTISNKKFEFVETDTRWQNPVKDTLFKLGLSGTKAWTKYIPDIYKYNSVENRIALLQGLMDTDGTIKKNGEASYTTTSKQLANDIKELVSSLGGRVVLRERNRIGKKSIINNGRMIMGRRISYEFNISLPSNINPFHISRKASRHRCLYIYDPTITEIKKLGKKEVQCIMIDHPEHLYITDGYIVTHNTLEEKMAPWIAPIQDNLDALFSKKENKGRDPLAHYKENGTIQVEALTYIRGRSLPNAFIIIDECQNMNIHEIKTILTRVGDGTKIVLTGDVEQIDNIYLNETNNGLTYAIEKLKDSELTGHITLIRGERSKVATLAAKLL